MKKIALILVLALFVSLLAPAMAAVTPAEILGTWYLSSFEYDYLNACVSGDYRIEFNRDKTAVMVLNGVEQQLTWELGDYGAVVTTEKGTEDFDLQEDGTLSADWDIVNGETDCIFTREKPAEVKIPEAVAASAEEEYFGTYVLTLQKVGDILLPFENGGEILTGKIEFALVTLSGSGIGSSGQAVMSDYQDGKVIIPAKGILSGAPDEAKLVIEKTESGIMVTCDVAPEMVYFLSPEGEEAVAETAEAAEPAEEAGAGE